MKSILVLGALALVLASAGARAADETVTVDALKNIPDECRLVRQAELPFDWVDGKMVVEIRVNDHPLHFIVDTGAVFSAIDRDAAKSIRLGRGPLGSGFTMTDTGGGAISHISRIDDIKFGSLKTGTLTLVEVALPKGLDGVLAPDLLRNFDVEIDPAHQVINLFKPHPCDEHVVYWTNDFAKLTISRSDFDQITIPVSIDGVTVRGLLDTGVAHTLIDAGDTKAALGANATLGPVHHMAAENGGDLSGFEARLDSFQIGRLKLVGAVVLANAHSPGWRFQRSASLTDMMTLQTLSAQAGEPFVEASDDPTEQGKSQLLVGTDILQNLHLLIDYQSWQVYVSKK
jgi:predicted aspartyl protease